MGEAFDRLKRILKGKRDAILDSMEDPVTAGEQLVIEMKQEYADAKRAAAQVFVNANRREEELREAQKEFEKWGTIAEKAVLAGNDDDARKALEYQDEWQKKLDTRKAAYEEAKKSADALAKSLEERADDIREAEVTVATIKADMENAKAARSVSADPLENTRMSALQKLAEKAEAEKIAATSAHRSFANTEAEDMEKKYASSPTDERLAALKAKLGK